MLPEDEEADSVLVLALVLLVQPTELEGDPTLQCCLCILGMDLELTFFLQAGNLLLLLDQQTGSWTCLNVKSFVLAGKL